MNNTERLRKRITRNAINIALDNNTEGTLCKTAFIFGKSTDKVSRLGETKWNFIDESYKSIQKNKDWETRLYKKHTHFKDTTVYEMQSANSSDALLMNIFCYPQFIKWKGPRELLNIDKYTSLTFGWNPNFSNESSGHKTEIDLKINDTDILIEAKLTESDFTSKDIATVEAYADFFKIFDENLLVRANGKYDNYQLIRNILATYKYNSDFILLIDETRTDLIRCFYDTVNAVKDKEFAKKLRFITWQELIDLTGTSLKEYITKKYFK